MSTQRRTGGWRARLAGAWTVRRALGKRPVLWLGLVAVIAPLTVLLSLQYYWLVDLERTSTIARRATLQKFLDAVEKEIYYFYATTAERTLNVPSSLFSTERIGKIAHFFKKAKPEGMKLLFVISYRTADSMLFYDPAKLEMVVPEYSNETLAVWAATAPFNIVAKRQITVEGPDFSVDERSPKFPMLLKPITDETWHVVGVAGMVVDKQYFEEVVLPRAIKATLPSFSKRDEFAVTVTNGQGRVVLTTDRPGDGGDKAVTRHFSFIFTDWKISLRDRYTTPERWARRNFALNMTMSVALGLVLLGGVALTLRTAAREMRLSEMKSDFVSNVSHELRTPLSSIRVFAEFMRLGRVVDPGKVREYGEYIEVESRRLTQLVNNILDFSRIESGRKEYSASATDLREVVGAAVDTFAVRTRSSGFRIEFEAPEEKWPPLEIDAGAIDQAVCNLLDNAVKYSGDSREIAVRVGRTATHATISVIDHGVGISRDEHDRVFDRFHRVSRGAVHDVRGSGLGLAIVRHVVEAHGGQVELESAPGEGSTFTILLPLGLAFMGGGESGSQRE